MLFLGELPSQVVRTECFELSDIKTVVNIIRFKKKDINLVPLIYVCVSLFQCWASTSVLWVMQRSTFLWKAGGAWWTGPAALRTKSLSPKTFCLLASQVRAVCHTTNTLHAHNSSWHPFYYTFIILQVTVNMTVFQIHLTVVNAP